MVGSVTQHPFQSIYNSLSQVRNLQEALQDPTANEFINQAISSLNQVQLEDLAIERSYIESLTAGQCMTVFESSHFEIAAFLLPAGFKLHLHDHPNMVVCSRLLHGSALIRSYSRLKKRKNGDVDARLEVDMNKDMHDEPWMLTPRHGNYHEIIPRTECVMLDILLPPYDDDLRQCNFYEARKKESVENGDGEGSNKNNYLLRKLSHSEQLAIQLPYMVNYSGFRPG